MTQAAMQTEATATTTTPAKPKRKRKWLRRFAWFVASLPVLAILLWIAIHKIRWLGPLLADTGRAILGPKAIAWIEEKTYGLQDDVNLATRKNEQPQQYWDVPTSDATAVP